MTTRLGRALRSTAQTLVVILVTALLFDVLAWFFAPPAIVRLFSDYQTGALVVDPADDVMLNGYYASHPERGFDHAPGRTGFFAADGTQFRVWTNALGCFDREWDAVPDGYDYFAGDSFTWAIAPYESKYATRFEALTGIPTLKCGVTNTGQRHQFSKFKEIAGRIGKYPKRVVVGYYGNDAANDYGYPQATVVRGCLVDRVFLRRDLSLATLEDADLEARTAVALREQQATHDRRGNQGSMWTWFRTHSITAHLLNRLRLVVQGRPASAEQPDGLAILADLERQQMSTRGPLQFRDCKWAEANKSAIREWQAHAREHGYELFFVLIPHTSRHADESFYSEVREFLEGQQIPYLDLAKEFARRGLSERTLYWVHDRHLSARGNELVGEILAASIPR